MDFTLSLDINCLLEGNALMLSENHSVLEFLHCTPVGSKLNTYIPNMAVPDLNKI